MLDSKLNQNNKLGFTLIELLVVISIIGVLIAVSIFGLSGARESARDARRKADLELVKSGLEIYKADCNVYPSTNIFASTSLTGNSNTGTCLNTNTYISELPVDPISATRNYVYKVVGNGYELYAALEQKGLTVLPGSCGGDGCNYKIINP